MSLFYSDSEPESKESHRNMPLFQLGNEQQRNLTSAQSSSGPRREMAETDNPIAGIRHTPPKDFVCPITSHLFNDPVTLETGQTYERKAIQEWLERGNSTCPITRHKLQSTQLPKTNYVLKRLIASWQEDHPGSYVGETAYAFQEPKPVSEQEVIMPAVSPNSVISQATIDGTMSELHHAIDNLCTCEFLKESEMAVLRIERFWKESTAEVEIQMVLSKPPVISGFVDILFNSVDPQVLKATISLLTELASRDKAVVQILTQVDSDVDNIVTLFKKGLSEALVLIYLLRPSFNTLIDRDMVESLVMVIKKKEENVAHMCLQPKTAAILLLAQIIRTNEETDTPFIVKIILCGKVIEKIVASLEAENSVERFATVGILLRCMQCDGKCRNVIADKAELAPILESFMGASESDQSETVKFLSELVRLNRRTFNEQILHILKDEGSFSTMHSLLVYLQTAPPELSPVVASLLLQLDLLTEPRKMSIYREEAIDTLISCLRNSENRPATQMLAAETIESLQGRFTSSGESLTRDLLLKRVGLDRSYKSKLRTEKLNNFVGETEENLEEEKAADEWERKTAFVLVSHEFGLLLEALAECLKSRYTELRSSCFVSAIWLIHMLGSLPDTGVRGAARVCLLKRIMSIFNTARDIEDRALCLLALNSFTKDSEGMQDMSSYTKDLMKGLRELRKCSPLAFEMLKRFSKGHDSSAVTDLWKHKEVIQIDCSANGEVLSIVCFKDRIFSGHSDGTIKVWTGRGSILHLIQETREHSKSVTSLAVMPPGDKLYSGSLDKTTRVWSISNEVMQCVQVHDMKEQVHNLTVASNISCYIPQGAGVKVHSWSGGPRLLSPNKYVKCLVLVQGKLYCGCQDSSIQEIDLDSGTLGTIQNGSRKLLTKSNPIQALKVYDGLIYSASSPLDGSAVKVWNATSFSMVGSVASTQEIRAMAVSSELIYLGCKGGIVEVWSREKYIKIETLRTGTNSKVMCMDLDSDEQVLVAGTSDGQIQAWALS